MGDRQLRRTRSDVLRLDRPSWVDPSIVQSSSPRISRYQSSALHNQSVPTRQYGDTFATGTSNVVIGDLLQQQHDHHHYHAPIGLPPVDADPDQAQAFVSAVLQAAAHYRIAVPHAPQHKEPGSITQWVKDVMDAHLCATSTGESGTRYTYDSITMSKDVEVGSVTTPRSVISEEQQMDETVATPFEFRQSTPTVARLETAGREPAGREPAEHQPAEHQPAGSESPHQWLRKIAASDGNPTPIIISDRQRERISQLEQGEASRCFERGYTSVQAADAASSVPAQRLSILQPFDQDLLDDANRMMMYERNLHASHPIRRGLSPIYSESSNRCSSDLSSLALGDCALARPSFFKARMPFGSSASSDTTDSSLLSAGSSK